MMHGWLAGGLFCFKKVIMHIAMAAALSDGWWPMSEQNTSELLLVE
jgi:hypothetical protein